MSKEDGSYFRRLVVISDESGPHGADRDGDDVGAGGMSRSDGTLQEKPGRNVHFEASRRSRVGGAGRHTAFKLNATSKPGSLNGERPQDQRRHRSGCHPEPVR